MDKTSLFIFEISPGCNLKDKHPECPINEPGRHPRKVNPLTDDKIIQLAHEASGMGFKGWFGWHYYNEPLMSLARIVSLQKKIREDIHSAKFCLWTNGTLIPDVCTPSCSGHSLTDLAGFDKIVITPYDGRNYEYVRTICPDVRIEVLSARTSPFDKRKHDLEFNNPDSKPCLRMFNEFVIDYYGECHLCCVDWRGHSQIGNINIDPLALCVQKFQYVRERVSQFPMSKESPAFCWTCAEKHQTCLDWVSHE